MRYAVVYVDTNGVPRLVGNGDNLSDEEANKLIATLEARHTKPHKLHYEKIGYTKETKDAVFSQRGICW